MTRVPPVYIDEEGGAVAPFCAVGWLDVWGQDTKGRKGCATMGCVCGMDLDPKKLRKATAEEAADFWAALGDLAAEARSPW